MNEKKINPFKLERYFDLYEFKIKHLLSCSDCEPLSVKELLKYADDESKEMWDNATLTYTESQGNPILLDEISKLYNEINSDDILHVVPEEGIYITMRSLIQSGDKIVCASPCYQSLYEIAQSNGAIIENWDAKFDNGWYFDVDELEKLVDLNTKMIVINFPHNPTGAMISKDDLDRVIQIAKNNDCLIFSDEMYRFLEHDENDRLPSVSEMYDNAISLCGLSKSFAMPGARCGWLVCKNKSILSTLKQYKDYTTICASATAEILSIMALRQKDRILQRNNDIISKNLKAADLFFEKYSNILSWNRPIAGSIGLPVLIDKLNVDEISNKLLDDINLMILPASVYDHGANAFRLGFGRTDFADNLAILENWLDKYLSNNQ